jgi:mono/diheme cytochrome c family protein
MRGRRTMPAFSGVLDRKQLERPCGVAENSANRLSFGPGRAKARRQRCICAVVAALSLLSLTAAASAADVNPAAAHPVAAQTLYQSQCAHCHGRSGQGDGPGAAQLHAHLHSFTDCGWMSMMSDATIFLVIKNGAAAAGFPAGMPAFGETLGDDRIVALVQYVRGFCAGKPNEPNAADAARPARSR